MTLCNMSIEAGATAAIVPPDDVTFSYVAGRRFAPPDVGWPAAVSRWRSWRAIRALPSASSSASTSMTCAARHLGHPTGHGRTGHRRRTRSRARGNEHDREAMTRAFEYMALSPGTPMTDVPIDRVFIGSCTNARLEDLRAAARVARGHHVRDGVHALVVPGSERVKAAAEREGLDQVFRDAGFEWREPGCSMCLGMNADILRPGRTLGLHQQPQFRGPARPWWAHAPGQPGYGRGSRGRRALCRRPRLGLSLMLPFRVHRGRVCRSSGGMSTPIRSSPSSF